MEFSKAELVGRADDRHDKHACGIRAPYVDRESQLQSAIDALQHIALPPKTCVHSGNSRRGLHQREGDDMGEGDLLGAARILERRVEGTPPFVEQLDFDSPKTGCGRNRQALLHVLDERAGWTAQWGYVCIWRCWWHCR